MLRRVFVFTFVFVLGFPSDGRCICCPVDSSIKVLILRYLTQLPGERILRACVAWRFVLVCSVLIVQGKCGLQVFRIVEFFVHTFQFVIFGCLQ